ncbi:MULTISPECIES: trp operon leader peptide [Lelliottia]|uniref:trp operon leader peptide n=1 Tax=Lelliottia nimipressuralis TaxID=69220 RepID=A0ABD4K5Q5_9ENTR|nr:hypothetical protein DAI21_14710 [Lelliottia sp. WB101]MBF4176872.1 trp operon leader peptide [Lelliottia nimipressuralis]MBL5882652.1 trp operon leader peptide [Lelliottia aquatilis]QMM55036.1 trp operon leader peptide [Enterobacter sp. RHB15-C17]NTZ44225.1 trp operon leader peptide [Lelliottia aquatilis]
MKAHFSLHGWWRTS